MNSQWRFHHPSRSSSECLWDKWRISYGHLPVITGYKWDYTFYKWGYKYLSKEVLKWNFRQCGQLKSRGEKSQKRQDQKKEDAEARKDRKVAKHCVFPMICGSGGSKSRLPKAAGAEPAGHRSDEKLHAVVARSTFPSQNVQNTLAPDHFWKLRCRKSARRCSAKHISKSKCTKHTRSGPLLEVEMSKKCTPLWCEAHFEGKSVKNWWSRTTFGGSDVEKVSKKCTPFWREAHFQVKMYKTLGVRTTFGSSDVEKVNAVVARSTFRSQKC